jgi:predicted acyl esterase
MAEGGGFAATYDADSEGVEGKFYVWSREEFAALLTDDEYEIAAAYFGLDRAPNFEDHAWNLCAAQTMENVAEKAGRDLQECESLLRSARTRLFAARGFHVVFQSCRGTFGSGGTFEPMVREVDDGHDTVEWLRGQPWFDGRLATMGLSYLGFTQWALLMDPPPELRTAVVRVGPHDFSEVAYGSGAFSLNDFLGWSDMVARQEDQNALRSLIGMATASRRLQPGLDGLPLADAAQTVLHGRAPFEMRDNSTSGNDR